MSGYRILCLHGKQTSSEVLETQLGAIRQRLEQEKNFEFVFVDGLVETGAHPSLEGHFQGPFFEWFTWNEEAPTAEDVESTRAALDFIHLVIEEQGPFDGVLGFSQGATLATALLLQDASQNGLASPGTLFRFAILFSAAGMAKLPDASSDSQVKPRRKLRVPSLHVSGTDDSYFDASQRVRDLWHPDRATSLVHKQGHVVPRDARTVQRVLDAIETLTINSMVF